MLTYGSVCSGIEAATQAWKPLGWKCAFVSEIDTFPQAVLRHHMGCNTVSRSRKKKSQPRKRGGVRNFGDFTGIRPHWLRRIGIEPTNIDVLVGGPPCQDFSVAGLRRGLDGMRGNLTLEFFLLAERLRTSWFVFENVPGLLSLDRGEAFAEILGLITGYRPEVPKGGWRNTGVCHGSGAYGIAWRVLDAQYVRVESHPRAVPQRRKRLFIVGHLGDWRRAAAVLIERNSLCGHSPPRRETGEGVAGTLEARASTGGFDPGAHGAASGYLQPIGVGGGQDVSHALTSCKTATGRLDPDGQTFVASIAQALTASNPYGDHDGREGLLVSHTLRGEGFDASEDGTGRGTPLVPVPFDTTQITSATNRSNPKPGDPCHPISASAHPPAIAFDCKASATHMPNPTEEFSPTLRAMNSANGNHNAGGQIAVTYPIMYSVMPQNSGKDYKARKSDVSQPLMTRPAGGNQGGDFLLMSQMAVRRLMPIECERLQGCSDNYTQIPWRNKPAENCPDGQRYRSLGNSKPINVVRWLGERIQIVDALDIRGT